MKLGAFAAVTLIVAGCARDQVPPPWAVVLAPDAAPPRLDAPPPRLDPAPPVDPPPEPDEDLPRITVGSCGIAEDRDRPIDAAAAAELRALVSGWISSPGWPRPGIEYRRGILFVESEEDRGDDPPYPRSAAAESQRVCGSQAQWLRSHLRQLLASKATYEALTCSDTACCYDGMEYVPNGHILFRRRTGDGSTWILDAWVQSQVLGIGPEYADANERYVAAAVRRLKSTGCPGEPDVAD